MSEFNSLDLSNDEQMSAVDSSSNYDAFTLGETEADDSQPEAVDQVEVAEGKQSREDNHIAKAARQKAEREAKAAIERAKAEAKAEYNQLLQNSGVKNPYTEKSFKSIEEFQEYGQRIKEAEQKERAEEEGKTLAEIQQEDADKEYLAKKRQEDSERANNEKVQEMANTRAKEDLAEFAERYPDIDVSNVITNEAFKKFAGTRLGVEPLADLYDDFTELVGEAEKNGRLKDTRGNRSTGSGNQGGVRLSASQQRDLEEWNRQYPELKMTPREFLSN